MHTNLSYVGTGGIKPNVCTMGADQFDDRYTQDRKEKESFFNWLVLIAVVNNYYIYCHKPHTAYFIRHTPYTSNRFYLYRRFYWSINLGSLISYTLVAYICQYGLPFLGGEKWGFFVGYCIPAIMMG
ncbi:hypothetical protein EON63_13035 [archaeon]|nr:MAG: hypothetical protein EON63_13035 [archaeon]